MMLFKCNTGYVTKFEKLSSGHRTGKGQFSFQSQRRAMPKNVQTTIQLGSFHMLVRLCTKSFKTGFSSVQFISVAQSCPTLCNPMNCSTPGLPVPHQLPELAQTHFHWVNDAIQPSHPLSPPSPPTFNLSPHQGLFQWLSSSHQVAKVLEFQL